MGKNKEPSALCGRLLEVFAEVQALNSAINDTLRLMPSQVNAKQLQLLSQSRLAPYMDACDKDPDRAWALYLWANELSGAFHSLIAHFEIAVRNALSAQLVVWNVKNGGEPEWSEEHKTQGILYELLKSDLTQARKRAKKAAAARPLSHPRRNADPVHDDIVSQLMFGSWQKLLVPLSANESDSRQKLLWKNCLRDAFPQANPSDASRVHLGERLDSVRRLRNRVSHHDNLLLVNPKHRISEMLGFVHKIDKDFPRLIMAGSRVRPVTRQDPRRTSP